MRDMNQTFEELGAYHSESFSLTGSGDPERVSGARVSVGSSGASGVRPIIGRLFEPGEDEPGADAQRVLLSHGLWTRRFGEDPGIVGRTITLDGRSTTVLGVFRPGHPGWMLPTSLCRSSGARPRIEAAGGTLPSGA